MKVNPDYKSIGDLFRDANVFHVPKYQRGYAWKKEQLDDFVDDLTTIMDDGNTEHFFGSLVCAQTETIGGHEKVNQLVDGQQRLTTFVILASRIILKYEQLNKNKDENEHSDYIVEKIKELKERYIYYKKSVNKKTEYVRRLTLSRRDDEYFYAMIKNQNIETERDSHSRICLAAKTLCEFVDICTKDKNLDEALDTLDVIEKTINESCNVIHMVTSQISDAYKLFQVINDRGENLNHTDLLRAKTLGIADDKSNSYIFPKVERIWDDLDKQFGGELEKLLGYYFSSFTGDKVKSSSFYDQCMDKIFNGGKATPELIVEKMTLINDELIKAMKISRGEWPYEDSKLTAWQRYRLTILILNLKHTHSIPLLLSATHLDENKFYEMVRVLEIFFFRYKHICKNKIDLATTRYLNACNDIANDKFSVQQFKVKLRELITKSATDEQFTNYLKQLEYSNSKTGDNRGMKYLLLGIEDSWRWYKNGMREGAAGREKNINYAMVCEFSTMTLEHVYPQNPEHKDMDLEQDLNKLGNITLLDPRLNSALGNIEYKEKLNYLIKDSKILINHEFENYPVWNRDSLSLRNSVLIEASKSIFIF